MANRFYTIIALACTLPGCASVTLRGPIDGEMANKVIPAAIVDGVRTFRITDSPGGSVVVAASMAGVLNGTKSRLIVDGECNSACALFALGVERRQATPRAIIAIHHVTAYGEHSDGGTQGSINKMKGDGVPPQIAEKARNADLYRLTPDDLAQSGVGR